jgi:S1-C subfamily serine protease
VNYLDLIIVISTIGMAVLGWFQGFAEALGAFVGFLVGAALGLVLAPALLQHLPLSVWVAIAAPLIVVAGAVAGRAGGIWLERRLRVRFHPRLNRTAEHVFGAALGAFAVISVSWTIGVALAGAALPHLSPAANDSTILRRMHDAHLPVTKAIEKRFVTIADRSDFPTYVDLFMPEHIAPVAAPPAGVVNDAGVKKASSSTWKISVADTSMTGSLGSGFLVAQGRLMTAAHVVAGGASITVDTSRGPLKATVAACDPDEDVAVLDVPGLRGTPLTFADAQAGDPAAVVGFPAGGPLTLTPARVREHLSWQSEDIDGHGRYSHDGYTIRGTVLGGNSGGPLVAPDGRVYGVVVASSRSDPDTGYVLSRQQVATVLAQGISAAPGPSVSCG